jgi:RNA polymerase sigma-70 factor (ECF subfamily)
MAGASAKDLIQRTFLRCFEARDRIKKDANFRAYLFGIARYVLLEHLRKARRQYARFDVMNTTLHDVSPQPTPHSMLAHKREVQLLMEALRRIPIDLQIILELFYWEHLSAREIGLAVGAPEGTVRTRLRRARQLLEREIGAIARSPDELQSTLSGLRDWISQIRQQLRTEA